MYGPRSSYQSIVAAERQRCDSSCQRHRLVKVRDPARRFWSEETKPPGDAVHSAKCGRTPCAEWKASEGCEGDRGIQYSEPTDKIQTGFLVSPKSPSPQSGQHSSFGVLPATFANSGFPHVFKGGAGGTKPNDQRYYRVAERDDHEQDHPRRPVQQKGSTQVTLVDGCSGRDDEKSALGAKSQERSASRAVATFLLHCDRRDGE